MLKDVLKEKGDNCVGIEIIIGHTMYISVIFNR